MKKIVCTDELLYDRFRDSFVNNCFSIELCKKTLFELFYLPFTAKKIWLEASATRRVGYNKFYVYLNVCHSTVKWMVKKGGRYDHFTTSLGIYDPLKELGILPGKWAPVYVKVYYEV